MNKYDYGIAILTYNHPEISAKCINSVLSVCTDHKIIHVIHNGSNAKNIQNLKNSYPNLRHLIVEENKGYSGGVNSSLNLVFENYNNILFLTNDTELVKLPESTPTGFNSVTIYKRNTTLIDSIYGELNIRYGKLKHLKSQSDITINPLYIPGSAFWLDKNTFNSIGLFDENFHTYWEDVDYSYRASLKKIKLGQSADTVVKHKIGKTCHKDDFYTYYLFQRNRKKFMLKHQLGSVFFWLSFLYDITKVCKYRFNYLWRILND